VELSLRNRSCLGNIELAHVPDGSSRVLDKEARDGEASRNHRTGPAIDDAVTGRHAEMPTAENRSFRGSTVVLAAR